MTITSSSTGAVELPKFASGSHLDDAGTTAASISLGFVPRYVIVDNVTDRTELVWYEGMTSTHAVKKVAAGTTTLETSGGVTVTPDDASATATIGFAVATNKQYRWVAFG